MPQEPAGIRQVRVKERSVPGRGAASAKARGWEQNWKKAKQRGRRAEDGTGELGKGPVMKPSAGHEKGFRLNPKNNEKMVKD